MRIGFQWKTDYKLSHAIGDRALLVQDRVPLAAKRVMEDVMRDSKANYVPVKTGALRNSGRVEEPVWAVKGWTVDAVYGNAGVNYALKQHETPYYYHPVGQWKYLEQPLLQASGTAAQVVAAELMW